MITETMCHRDERQTYRGGRADPDSGPGRRGRRPLADVGHRLALRLGLSLGQDLLRDHDQLTLLRPDKDHS